MKRTCIRGTRECGPSYVDCVEGDIEYKVHWKNYAKRDATWEPSAYLSDYGDFDLVAKYNDKLEAAGHTQPGGKPSGKRKGSVRYVGEVTYIQAGASRATATIMDEDLHIVMEVMAKRKLEGSIAQWLVAYNKAKIVCWRYVGVSRAAVTIMAKRKLEGSIAQWLEAYKAEIAKVERLRVVDEIILLIPPNIE